MTRKPLDLDPKNLAADLGAAVTMALAAAPKWITER